MYRTNKYLKPLLTFVGVNNHYRNSVFGVALLCDETIESFLWAIEMFLQAMDNKKPKVEIIDGNNVTCNAVSQLRLGAPL